MDLDIASTPLWDHPILETEGYLISDLRLLAEALPEIKERLKKKDQTKTQPDMNQNRHDELIQEVKSISNKFGYYERETTKPIKEGEIDLLVERNGEFIDFECKEFSLPWGHRFFQFSNEELDKFYPDFLKDERIDSETWKAKCELIDAYIKQKYSDQVKSTRHIVVTRVPVPIPDKHTYPEIVWLHDLNAKMEELLHK